jgi:hypothetical protein
MAKVLLATGVEPLDKEIARALAENRVEVAGEGYYLEGILPCCEQKQAGVVVVSPELEGSASLEETILTLRHSNMDIRCVVLPGPEDLEDSFVLASRIFVTGAGVYDFVFSSPSSKGSKVNVGQVVERVLYPATFADAETVLAKNGIPPSKNVDDGKRGAAKEETANASEKKRGLFDRLMPKQGTRSVDEEDSGTFVVPENYEAPPDGIFEEEDTASAEEPVEEAAVLQGGEVQGSALSEPSPAGLEIGDWGAQPEQEEIALPVREEIVLPVQEKIAPPADVPPSPAEPPRVPEASPVQGVEPPQVLQQSQDHRPAPPRRTFPSLFMPRLGGKEEPAPPEDGGSIRYMPHQLIAIWSPSGFCLAFTAFNLAALAAATGFDVALVNYDLLCPELDIWFGIKQTTLSTFGGTTDGMGVATFREAFRADYATKFLKKFIETLRKNILFLQANNMISIEESGKICATKIGKLCSTCGVEIETFLILQNILNQMDVSNWETWEVIFPCLHCIELKEMLRINFRAYYTESQYLYKCLKEINPKRLTELCKWSKKLDNDADSFNMRIKVFLILNYWINGIEMRRIEDSYSTRNRYVSGPIIRIAEMVSWMVDTMRKIALTTEYDIDFANQLQILSDRLVYGIPAEGIALSKLNVRGLTRTVIKRIINAGYASFDKILDTPAPDFTGIINPKLAVIIQEKIIKNFNELQGTAKLFQAGRLEKLGHDSGALRAIYELSGISLEHAVVDLLNSPPLELGAERISRQREGEPDVRLALEEGLLVGSVTASNSNISERKCAEIISSGASMNPSAYVVFGRPGFHELAIRNAPNINSQLDKGKVYNLISIKDLGELFVRVAEGRLSKAKFI